MENRKYVPIIGMEIHVELKTNSKMFCGCKNDPFHAPKPNIYTCPVCLGLPGALPVPNKKAIEWTIMLGLALDCRINKYSKFDRKHYFYPDLPKGYQISQYGRPFCHIGKIQISNDKLQINNKTQNSNSKQIRIRRVHLEEDTGKLIHKSIRSNTSSTDSTRNVTLIDFNRSGVPLVEIVTEPDMRSAEEAKEYAKKIHQIVRSLEISDADMEKGSMRLEANVSLFSNRQINKYPNSPIDQWPSGIIPEGELPNYKVELKNINSFRFLEKAINMEVQRQTKALENGEKLLQQTWGWDSRIMKLKLQRSKEEAADYRYFPDPDIPPISFTDAEITSLKLQIPKLPEEICKGLIELGVSENAARIISGNKVLSDKTLQALRGLSSPGEDSPQEARSFANWILHHMEEAKEKIAEELVKDYGKTKSEVVGDSGQLEKWVEEAMKNNPKVVVDIKSGKQQAIGFLIGQVQKMAKGKANVKMVMGIIREKINL